MGKGISIQPVKGQVNKVVKLKSPRGNIHNSFRHDHKAADVKSKHEHLKELKQQNLRELQQQMYNRLWGAGESNAPKELDVII